MKNILLLFFFTFCSFSSLFAQVDFHSEVGGTRFERALGVAATADGGAITVGYTFSYGAGQTDIMLVKTSAMGLTEWTKTYGGTQFEFGHSVVVMPDGGYVVAGSTNSVGRGNDDVLLFKTDAMGGIEWAKTYGGTNKDNAYNVITTADGGLAIAGNSFSFSSGLTDAFVIKTDAMGVVQWAKQYGTRESDNAYDLKQTADGGYIVGGYTFVKNSLATATNRDYDYLLFKITNTGDVTWWQNYGGTAAELGFGMAIAQDGGYLLSGYTGSFGAGNLDGLLLKTNSAGVIQWTKTLGSFGAEELHNVAVATNGDIFTTGYSLGMTNGEGDVYMNRLSAMGDLLWSKHFGGVEDETAFGLVKSGEDFLISGQYGVVDNFADDFLTMKINTNTTNANCIGSTAATVVGSPTLGTTPDPLPAGGIDTLITPRPESFDFFAYNAAFVVAIQTGLTTTNIATPNYINSATCSNILPLEWVDFRAKMSDEKTVRLDWITLNERQNDRFEIQRSENGTDGWENIGSLKALNKNNATNEYTFTDFEPKTNNYYRLQQIDTDGKTTFSSIKNVNLGHISLKNTFQIYPNPTQGTVYFNQTANIQLLNLQGNILLSAKTNNLHLSDFPKGTYLLKIQDENGKLVKTEKITFF